MSVSHVVMTTIIVHVTHLLFFLDPEADREATDMLTNNAQNLMKAVSEVLYATEAATIRVPIDVRANLTGVNWVKRSNRKATLA